MARRNLYYRLAEFTPMKRPNLPNGGLRFPHAEDGPFTSDLPPTFSACRAVALGDAADPGSMARKKIATELFVNLSQASAHQLKRVLPDPDGETTGLLTFVDEFVAPLT